MLQLKFFMFKNGSEVAKLVTKNSLRVECWKVQTSSGFTRAQTPIVAEHEVLVSNETGSIFFNNKEYFHGFSLTKSKIMTTKIGQSFNFEQYSAPILYISSDQISSRTPATPYQINVYENLMDKMVIEFNLMGKYYAFNNQAGNRDFLKETNHYQLPRDPVLVGDLARKNPAHITQQRIVILDDKLSQSDPVHYTGLYAKQDNLRYSLQNVRVSPEVQTGLLKTQADFGKVPHTKDLISATQHINRNQHLLSSNSRELLQQAAYKLKPDYTTFFIAEDC